MRALVVIAALAGCEGVGPREQGEDERDLAATLTTRTIASLEATPVRGMALAALDESRVAIARADSTGEVFCPDCALDPDGCPNACERTTVSAAVMALDTGELAGSRVVATVYAESFGHSVGQVEVVALGGDRVGVAWLVCDNARCGGVFAALSCTARYATLDLTTGAVGTTHTLYEDWFGDLSLAFDQTSRRLLAVLGKDLVFGGGLFRAIYDEHASVATSPWASIGSIAARSPALLAHGGRLDVFADDWSPLAAPRAQPCSESCECLDEGTIDLEHGGLYAFDVDTGNATLVATGRDDRGFYARREQLSAVDAGGRVVVAAGQSVERSAELFTREDEIWTASLATEAPLPLWIGALGTADHAAWIGATYGGGRPTVQQLVAGIAGPSSSTFAVLDDALDRSVLLVEPIPSAAGVTTNLLLQGVYDRSTPQTKWARFDVLAVDAVWP